MTVNMTEIILGFFTLLGMCGWFVEGRKHKQAVEGMKADNLKKIVDLVTDLVDDFKKQIVIPLESQVEKLRTEVNQLRDAIQKIPECPHSGNCPVRDELRKQQDGNKERGAEPKA